MLCSATLSTDQQLKEPAVKLTAAIPYLQKWLIQHQPRVERAANHYPPVYPQGPGSGSPWTSSWGLQPPGSQFNPTPPPVDSGKPWRAGYGGIAPIFPVNPQPPDRDSNKPWHNNRGDIWNPPLPLSPSAPSDPVYNPGLDTNNPTDVANPRPSPWEGPVIPEPPPGTPTDRPTRPDDGGQDRTSGVVTPEDVLKALNQDLSTRSESTFNSTVSAAKALATQNEDQLKPIIQDWTNQQNSIPPLTYMRGTAALADGLGQSILEQGSRIDWADHPGTQPRILKGCNYDFGGEAATSLNEADVCLSDAQQYVRGHKGLVINGQSMDDAYLQQLSNLQTDVQKQLNIVYGAHDNLESIYNFISNEVYVHSEAWQHGLFDMQNNLDALKTNDNRFVAKCARDVALGYMAEANYMLSQGNGMDAKIMWRDANKDLSLSMNRDPDAPDNKALQAISLSLAPKINPAIDQQYNDPFNNPFQIPSPASNYA